MSSPRRTLFALLITLLTSGLLGIATYSFFADSTGVCSWADKSAPIAWSQVDFTHRVHLAMNRANTGTPRYDVPLLAAAGDTASPVILEAVTIKGMRAHGFNRASVEELGLAGLLFGAFGLFILWWGRDTASLWLGLFGAAYGATLFRFYGPLPEWGMLVAWTAATVLSFVAAYALYAMAEVFALESVPNQPYLRRSIEIVRTIALCGLAIGLLATLGEKLAPILAQEEVAPFVKTLRASSDVFTEIFVKAVIPVAMLAFAWWFARDATTKRKNLAILATVAAGLSGVAVSIVGELLAHRPPAFDWPWFTLLALPIGFIIAIRTYKIVDVQVVIKRILVVTAMTAIIGAAIAGTEVLIEHLAAPMVEQKVALKFAVAFIIVLTFGHLHHWLDVGFKRLIFAKRDQAVADMHTFASKRAAYVTSRERLIEQTVALVRHALCANGVAFFEPGDHAYRLAKADGVSFAGTVDVDDPALVALRSTSERVDLATLRGVPSAFGHEGLALRLTVRGRAAGVLVVGPRENASDGDYEPEELAALADIVRGVADALFGLHAAETAAFVRAVAAGTLTEEAAAQRAGELLQTEGDLSAVVPAPEPPGGETVLSPERQRVSQASGATG